MTAWRETWSNTISRCRRAGLSDGILLLYQRHLKIEV